MRSFTRCVRFLLATIVIVGTNALAQYRAEFPNELDGFKFHRTGRLTNISLTLSSTEDVVRILGEECLKACDLDENWRVHLSRAQKGGRACTGVGCTTLLTMLPEYVGRVWEISVTPRKRLSFSEVRFSEKFKRGSTTPVIWDKNRYTQYWDEHHLSYTIYAENSVDGKNRKGDLKEILYRVPWKEDLPFYSVSKCPSRCF